MDNFSDLYKNKKFKVREIEGKYYLYGNGSCYLLNDMGAIVWKYVGKDMMSDEFIGKVNTKYEDTTPDQIRTDVDSYINFLISIGAVGNGKESNNEQCDKL
ncbi:MAG: PqqD family protein [Oscillospiraceae bacterium]|jgi:hypothetical protein